MTEHFVIEITWNDETMHSEEFEVDSLLQIGKNQKHFCQVGKSLAKKALMMILENTLHQCSLE